MVNVESEPTPERQRSMRCLTAALAAMVGVFLSVAAFLVIAQSESRQAELDFTNRARSYHQTIKSDLANAASLLLTLRGYFSSTDRPISRGEFQAFSKTLRERVVGLRDTGWAPRVAGAERDAFERAVRDDGFPDFEIRERDGEGKLVRAAARDEYFPILSDGVRPHLRGDAPRSHWSGSRDRSSSGNAAPYAGQCEPPSRRVPEFHSGLGPREAERRRIARAEGHHPRRFRDRNDDREYSRDE